MLGVLLCLASGIGFNGMASAESPTAGSPLEARQNVERGPFPFMPGRLRRGINITGWFRFPANRDPSALAAYLSDPTLADIHAAGFDFVRLALDPEVVDNVARRAALIAAIQRIQRQGLTVVVSPHPHDWHLETSAADRDRLLVFWKTLAPALKPLDPGQTVPEILNEPVFPGDPGGWQSLQHRVLGVIRQGLPHATVVLTGQDWGSIGGLLALTPEDDLNVVYSFHFYDPAELTSLAAYRSGLDRVALARLPFPADDTPRCEATAGEAADPPTRDLMQYYCALRWDPAHIGAIVDRAAAWGLEHHVHLLAGEFGATKELTPPRPICMARHRSSGARTSRYWLGAVGIRRRHGPRRKSAAAPVTQFGSWSPDRAGYDDRDVNTPQEGVIRYARHGKS